MSDIAALLKSEITRLSKKVLRQHVTPLQTAATAQRRQIANLKKQVIALEREVSKLRRATVSNVAAKPEAESNTNIRFVAKGFKSMRARLGISAEDLGRLLGVSGQTVYNWEHQKAKPRASQIAAIAALRGIGKKEAQQRLAAADGQGE
jgi:DNA-binding transcriptional regulator YiaG